MVNLRYHIISLTAVFLALGLGILAGTTVIDQQVVSNLRANTNALRHDLDRTRAQVGDLENRLDVWDKFGAAVEPPLLDGLLAGRAVAILSDARVSGDVLTDLTDALTFANAKRPTRLALTEKWTLESPASTAELARIVGTSATGGEEVVAQAAAKLGSRLGTAANPRADRDLIKTLADADFLDVNDLPATGSFPAANALVIVVSSGDPSEVPDLDDFFMPMVRILSGTRIVAVAEPTTVAGNRSLAERVRDDRDIARAVCTIDHVDTVPGHISIVYALRALGAGGPASHYGVRDKATAIVPDVRPA